MCDDLGNIPADSVVRNEENGRRLLHNNSQVIRAMTEDPYHKPPVMPRSFPNGLWTIYEPQPRTSRYLRPWFIPTDAFRELPVWKLDIHGGYDKETEETVTDIGYGIHYSSSRTTVGCIRVADLKDLNRLVECIFSYKKRNESVFIEAQYE
jgi:hypothetical protein